MRRLRLLAQRQGLWTTHVTITVNSQHLVVIDPLSGSVMEKFAMPLIYRPTVVNESSNDIYNNVAVITVIGDASQQTVPEVHVFQGVDQTVSDGVPPFLTHV